MTDIETLEHWITNAKKGDELVFYSFDNDSRDLHRVANENAALARIWETLKRDSSIYLEIDNLGRCIATKL